MLKLGASLQKLHGGFGPQRDQAAVLKPSLAEKYIMKSTLLKISLQIVLWAVISIDTAHSSILLVTKGFGSSGGLASIDIDTWQESFIADTPTFPGLASTSLGNHFALDTRGPKLDVFSLDPATGVTIETGVFHTFQALSGATVNQRGELIISSAIGDIYRANFADSSLPLLRSLGTPIEGVTAAPVEIDVFGIGKLQAGTILAINTGRLHVLDANTYVAQFVGNIGHSVANASIQFLDDGTLLGFGWDGSSGSINSINLTTLAATTLATLDYKIEGSALLRSAELVPLPSTLFLFAAGFVAFTCYRRRSVLLGLA